MSNQQVWAGGQPFPGTVLIDPATGEAASSDNPVPVMASPRTCVGRQTLSVTTGAVATLTVPTNAVACAIQADGNSVSITLDGTNPTSTIGSRIDDGVFYYVDTSLAAVKLIARTATTNVQVVYFNKA
jgi:hypothetical protein